MEDATDEDDEPDTIRNIEKTEKEMPEVHQRVPDTKANEMKSKRPIRKDQEYCQPTSSKVLVEDLVTTKEDEEHFHEYHTAPDEDKYETHRPAPATRRFWDRPITQENLDWPGDDRMPEEWNAMMSDVWSYGNRLTKGDSIGPFEFTSEWYPCKNDRQRLRDTMSIAPDWGTTESIRMAAMIEQNESRNHRKPRKVGRDRKGKQRKMEYTEDDIPELKQAWYDEYEDLLQGVPETMPPFRAVNHEIPLIDPTQKYRYHLPRCPNSLKAEFNEKVEKYTRAGWWTLASANQAAPMLCLPKKDRHLRTVVDCRQRNENTVKDVTPMPDQDDIREDVARAKYRSKIDLSDAYEQVRIIEDDIWKTAFATIRGTYTSAVMQQGDCNAPATFQRLMTSIFQDVIGVFMHVYIDDIFVFSDSIEDHQEHLRIIFERLREQQLFMKWKKCELYAKRVDCLGYIIDDEGLHADEDKLTKIMEWRTPRTYLDIQRFVGLVQYLATFLPDITAYTSPLLAMTQNGNSFNWRPIHQRCFDMIKATCNKTPILKPIDPRKGESIWVICDASKSGIRAMYGQGDSWQTCRPAGFMSKKFTNAQHNYRVHELETLAILEALMKWEDKLMGYRIHVITDHKALEFFKTQSQLSGRQLRWTDYMSRFDFDITYVKGDNNKVADCLSRYYENDTYEDVHGIHEYIRADVRVDPTGEDLPPDRLAEIVENLIEMRAMQEETRRRSQRIKERTELRDIEAQEMAEANQGSQTSGRSRKKTPPAANPAEITIEDMLASGPDFCHETVESDMFKTAVREGYASDRMMKLIVDNPADHPLFRIEDDMIWTKNRTGDDVLCIPRTLMGDKSIIGIILEQAHSIFGHYGYQRTSEYVRRWYWWPRMVHDTKEFCKTCEACQVCKGSNKPPTGKLHPLPIPTKPWDSVGMDFIGPFPEVKADDGRTFNYLWVVVCRMTTMVHLIPVHTTMTAKDLSSIYMREIVRLHGLPSTIVSDRDPKFTSRWWRELHRILGARLLMSTSFHPQTDGLTERMNRSIGQIFRADLRPDQKDWLLRVNMTEFAINTSVSSTTGYAPFETNSGFMPSMIREIRETTPVAPGIRKFAATALQNLADAHDAIIEHRVFQSHHANKKRGNEPWIETGDLVYLSTKNLNLLKGRARKLCPKYVGPYKVAWAQPDTSTYTLELPVALQERQIHPTFHVSLLRPYQPNNDLLFPNRAQPDPYDFGTPDTAEWFVDEIVGHRWNDEGKLMYHVRWSMGDTTWEPHSNCKELAALDRYLETMGVRMPSQLPRKDMDTTNMDTGPKKKRGRPPKK